MSSVIAAVEALPESGLTIRALQALDFAVPGEWSNTRDFNQILADVSGQDNPRVVALIRQRAQLMDTGAGMYDEALRVYQLVDSVDQLAAGAAVASKVTGMFSSLGFLEKYTPKPETTQSVDAGLKLVAELLAFGLLNGMPSASPDGLAKFAGALGDYGKYDLMRIAAWVVYDGIVPLGPNFIGKILETFQGLASETLTDNAVFKQVGGKLPGNTAADKRDFILKTMNTTGEWVGRFVEDRGITAEKVQSHLSSVLSVAEGGGDYVAAAIDAGTAFTAHTGTQTVARVLAKDAYTQLKDDVWEGWLKEQS